MNYKRKEKNEIQTLRDELYELKEKGYFKNPAEAFINELKEKINQKTKDFMDRRLKKYYNYFTSNFKRDFLKHKRNCKNNNIGLRTYKLKDLDDDFLKAYKTRQELSLSLIKTQNDEVMLKLRRRFLDWMTLADTRNKAFLKEMTAVPLQSKRVKFILKDQTNKLIGNMDNIIAEKYDAICFQWKTRNNNRVVGRPGGLYPKPTNPQMHGDHWGRRDKYFYYPNNEFVKKGYLNLSKFVSASDEIEDGLPSMPIGCRCYAKNIYELSDVPKELLSKKGLEYLGLS